MKTPSCRYPSRNGLNATTVLLSACLSLSALPHSVCAFNVPSSTQISSRGWTSYRHTTRAASASRDFTLFAVGKSASDPETGEPISPRSSEFEVKESTIDWDGEWKQVLENQDSSVTRDPGRTAWTDADRAKHKVTIAAMDAKIAAKKATNSLQIPSVDSLTGDWRFWLGLIALISFGSAFIGTVGQDNYGEQAFMVMNNVASLDTRLA